MRNLQKVLKEKALKMQKVKKLKYTLRC